MNAIRYAHDQNGGLSCSVPGSCFAETAKLAWSKHYPPSPDGRD